MVVREAIAKNTPPKGLTPSLHLTAMGQTQTLMDEVSKHIKNCGLSVRKALINHYTTLTDNTN